MAVTELVLMPGEHYQAICDRLRLHTGQTGPLTSGDILDLLDPELTLDPEILKQGGAYPASLFIRTVTVPPEADYLDFDTFREMPNLKELRLYADCEYENYREYVSSLKSYQNYTLMDRGDLMIEKLVIGGNMTKVPSSFAKLPRLKELVVEEGVTSLGFYSFLSCGALERVTLPRSCTSLGGGQGDALPGGCTIRCYAGSYAETWAISRGWDYEVIEE